jgi:hypothetical protein
VCLRSGLPVAAVQQRRAVLQAALRVPQLRALLAQDVVQVLVDVAPRAG